MSERGKNLDAPLILTRMKPGALLHEETDAPGFKFWRGYRVLGWGYTQPANRPSARNYLT